MWITFCVFWLGLVSLLNLSVYVSYKFWKSSGLNFEIIILKFYFSFFLYYFFAEISLEICENFSFCPQCLLTALLYFYFFVILCCILYNFCIVSSSLILTSLVFNIIFNLSIEFLILIIFFSSSSSI